MSKKRWMTGLELAVEFNLLGEHVAELTFGGVWGHGLRMTVGPVTARERKARPEDTYPRYDRLGFAKLPRLKDAQRRSAKLRRLREERSAKEAEHRLGGGDARS